MIKYFRNDFRSVHSAIKELTKGKMPTWVIVIYYALLLPIGLLLLQFTKLYWWIRIKKLEKELGL